MHLFQTATLRLTAGYLAIVMTVSLLFSFAIYQINFHEIDLRLQNFQDSLSITRPVPLSESTENLRRIQTQQAALQMALNLIYANVVVFLAGGIGSYYLARRTLLQLEQLHDAQSRFTSDASHELRTPLTTMRLELEMALKDDRLDETETRELLVSTLEEVNKLIKLSEMLLTLSRMEQGTLEQTKLSLAEVAEHAILRFKQPEKRFFLMLTPVASVRANESALLELVTILIDNALKYSPNDSKIRVETGEKAGSVSLKIGNAGTKISDELMPRLFERFVRGDESRTSSGQNGFGLGLSLAKEIVRIHNGTIDVDSTDAMTTFTVSLPAAQPLKSVKHKVTT